MKKVALISDPWVGAVCRARAFVKETDPSGYEFTFVNMHPDLSLSRSPDFPLRIISSGTYNKLEYDLVLAMNDKHFSFVLEKYSPHSANMIDKLELARASESFGLSSIKLQGFSDSDKVFVKPRIGAGQYSTDDYSYRPHRFGDIKGADLSPEKFIIQQYIFSPIVVSVTVVCNGSELEFIDVTEAHHTYDRNGKNLNCHLESMIHIKDKYSRFIQATFDFLKYIHYDSIPGLYMLQFMTENGKIYLTDFNIRTGPVSDMMTLNNRIHRIHRMIPFMSGEAEFKKVNIPHLRYRCYLESEGVPISTRVKFPDKSRRILLSEDKTSGIIRNDYQSYLEILETEVILPSIKELVKSCANSAEIIKALESDLTVAFSPAQKEAILCAKKEELERVVAEQYMLCFFEKKWKSPLSEEEKKAMEEKTVKFINRHLGSARILDIGCGFNHFKKYFGEKLVGIDPANTCADVRMTLEEFADSTKEQFDIIIGHGSLHFGSKEEISSQLKIVKRLLAPKGFLLVRFNTGRLPKDHRFLNVCTFWKNHDEVLELFKQEFTIYKNKIECELGHRLIFTCQHKKVSLWQRLMS